MNETVLAIYQTLGAKALFMLGAKDMAYSNKDNSLMFKIRGSQKYNHITITHDGGNDLYNVRFVKFRGIDIKSENTITGIYCDMLHSTIETNTGLYTSL